MARFRNKLQQKDASALLRETEEAIRANNQSLASAAILRYGDGSKSKKRVVLQL